MSEPTRITDKYLAGFIDADGSFGINFIRVRNGFVARLSLTASQLVSQDKVIELIAKTYGGKMSMSVNPSGSRQAGWGLPQKEGRMILSRIAKHLVLKRSFAKFCLDFVQQHRGKVFSEEEIAEAKAQLHEARKARSLPLPNYPSRQWLAGYFDGDGCIASRLNNGTALCTPAVLAARIEDERTEGLELIAKAFGGDIYQGRVAATKVWVLNLEPSKATKFIGHFCKHSIVKRAQLYFALRCAEGGNYRDGAPIHAALQMLKAQEHRLSDPEVNVSPLLSKVRFDVPDGRGRWDRSLKRQSEQA